MKTIIIVFYFFFTLTCVCGQFNVHSCFDREHKVLVALRSGSINIGCHQTSSLSSCSISKSGFQLCSSSACIEDERISFTGILTNFTSCQFELKQLELSGIKKQLSLINKIRLYYYTSHPWGMVDQMNKKNFKKNFFIFPLHETFHLHGQKSHFLRNIISRNILVLKEGHLILKQNYFWSNSPSHCNCLFWAKIIFFC